MAIYAAQPMTKRLAQTIGQWEYPPPYTMYSLTSDPNIVEELMDGSYWAVIDDRGDLQGYYCVGPNARVLGGESVYGELLDENVLDIGLGMNPNYVGTGNGRSFVTAVLEFAAAKQPVQRFRLTVAAFNRRAIRVYEALGFRSVGQFPARHQHNVVFVVMVLQTG